MVWATIAAKGKYAPDGLAYDYLTLIQELRTAFDGMGELALAVPVAAVATVAGNGIAVAAADAAAVAGTIPAGGTGATEGAYDSAANRNTMLATVGEMKTTVNALVTEATELKADITTLSATVVEIKASLNDALAKLRTAGLITP
jgi:hypothetical protein